MGDLPRVVSGRDGSAVEWRQIAPVADKPSATTLLAAWIVGTGPLALQLDRVFVAGWLTTLTVFVGLFAIRFGRRWPSWAPVICLASGLVLYLAFGSTISPSVVFIGALSPTLWGLALEVIGPRWTGMPRTPLVQLVMAPATIAAVFLVTRAGVRVPAVLTAVSIALIGGAVALSRSRWSGRLGVIPTGARRVRRIGEVISGFADHVIDVAGRVIGAVAMLPAAVLITVAWLGRSAVGSDPLAAPTAAGGYWVRRQGDDPAPTRLFARVDSMDRRRAISFRRVGTSLLVVAILGSMAFEVSHIARYGEPYVPFRTNIVETEAIDPVMDQDPGWPQIGDETDEFQRTGQFDAVTVFRFPDFESTYIHEKDGKRRTWMPDCRCEPLRVWWFGGSAAWGWWQRDEFTIPSQIARIASDRGVPIEVTNYAVPGWTLGQEVRQFAQLAVTEEPPDLVLFYDGGNDLNKQKDRNQEGRGDDESETSFSETVVDDVLVNGPFHWGKAEPNRRESAWPDDTESLSSADVAKHAMVRYERNVRLGKLIANSIDTQVVFLWQPLLPSSLPKGGPITGMTNEDALVWRGMLPVAKSLLPEGTIDLSDSLDDVERWVFKDIWHTNEYGAEVVARAVVEVVEPELRRLAARQG